MSVFYILMKFLIRCQSGVEFFFVGPYCTLDGVVQGHTAIKGNRQNTVKQNNYVKKGIVLSVSCFLVIFNDKW